MIREACAGDAEILEDYLACFPATTMFLRSNLAKHGVGWSEAAHSTRYFVWKEDGSISAVFGMSKSGFLMAEASSAPAEAFQAFSKQIAGVRIAGMTGEIHSVEGTLSALGLSQAEYRLSRDEPLLHLHLNDLANSPLTIRKPCEADRETLSEWMEYYELDTGLSENETQARSQVSGRLSAALATDTGICLAVDERDTPIAMAGINASVADIVQVGSVFVPRALRRRGLGRHITAALLQEARENGARQALLFAASAMAERAYLAIGFRPVGTYRLALLSKAQRVGGIR